MRRVAGFGFGLLVAYGLGFAAGRRLRVRYVSFYYVRVFVFVARRAFL